MTIFIGQVLVDSWADISKDDVGLLQEGLWLRVVKQDVIQTNEIDIFLKIYQWLVFFSRVLVQCLAFQISYFFLRLFEAWYAYSLNQ